MMQRDAKREKKGKKGSKCIIRQEAENISDRKEDRRRGEKRN